MATPFKFYLKHMFKKSNYRAIWDPGRNLELGMVGKLDSYGSFTTYTSLAKEGIDMEVSTDDKPIDQDYSSTDTVEITAKASGTSPVAGSFLTELDAGFSIKFKGENGVVFRTQGQYTDEIVNIAELEKAILKKYKEKNWDKDWLIITRLVRVDSGTIIISNSSNTNLELRAKGNLTAAQLNVADAGLGLNTAWEKGSSMKFIGQAGMTPLYSLMGVRHPLIGKASFSDKGVRPGGAAEDKLMEQPFDPAELED